MEDDFITIAITPEYPSAAEARSICTILEGFNIDRVHIRHPHISEEAMRHILDAIPESMREDVTIHDHFELAAEYGVHVHCNSRCPQAPADVAFSASAHSMDEVRTWLARGAQYVTLSPIFDSLTKHGYTSRFDPISTGAAVRGLPVVALGGVTFSRLDDLRTAGFGGAAMIGDIGWRSLPFRLMFITNSADPAEVVYQASEAIRGGVSLVQIRMKDAPDHVIAGVVKQVSPWARSAGVILMVDDRVELAASMPEIDGVHVGRNDMDSLASRRLIGPDKILGVTANTAAHIIDTPADARVDYFGVGPFRFTTTKKKLSPVIGLDGYEKLVAEVRTAGIEVPLVAIGGIEVNDVASLFRAGMDGIAVSGAISKALDMGYAAHEFSVAVGRKYRVVAQDDEDIYDF